MKTQPQHNPQLEKIKDLIEDIKIAMLTTKDETEHLVSRPMSVQEMDGEGNIWFFTQEGSPKTNQINMDFRVNLAFADPGKQEFVSISGSARLLDDRQKVEELWNPIAKIWFPGGKDDPNIRLLKVETHLAEYWDSSANKMVQLFNIAKSLLTGEDSNLAENEKVFNTPASELIASESVHVNPINLSVPFKVDV